MKPVVREVRALFDKEGRIFHVDEEGATESYLPDSRDFWLKLETAHLELKLGGVAHTHPWQGLARFSPTDLKTMNAVDQFLGSRLLWAVVTASESRIEMEGRDGSLQKVVLTPAMARALGGSLMAMQAHIHLQLAGIDADIRELIDPEYRT